MAVSLDTERIFSDFTNIIAFLIKRLVLVLRFQTATYNMILRQDLKELSLNCCWYQVTFGEDVSPDSFSGYSCKSD